METRSVVAYKSPLGADLRIVKQTFRAARPKPAKRVSFLAGLHGDELEGVYVCYLLTRYLRRLEETRPEAFLGEVHVYPAANPQAICNGSRLWPFFSADMNRLMGKGGGDSLPAVSSSELLADLKAGSDLVVDFHASNQRLVELPQIRVIEEFERKLVPLAEQCNVDLVWVHPMAGMFESTLGYNLNRARIPALVVELGIGLRIHQEFGEQVFRGMVNLLRHAGVLAADDWPDRREIKKPLTLKPEQIGMVQAKRPGLFVSHVRLGQRVKKGDKLGELVEPVCGEIVDEITSPFDGLLFTLRELPLTYEGAPLVRVALHEPDWR